MDCLLVNKTWELSNWKAVEGMFFERVDMLYKRENDNYFKHVLFYS